MKYSHITVVCSVLSLATAATISDESQAETTSYENTNDGTGNYRYSFRTSNGIIREESGHLVNLGQEDEHMVVEGWYSYTDPEGKLTAVYYTADDNGYHIVNPAVDKLPVTFGTTSIPANVVASLLG